MPNSLLNASQTTSSTGPAVEPKNRPSTSSLVAELFLPVVPPAPTGNNAPSESLTSSSTLDETLSRVSECVGVYEPLTLEQSEREFRTPCFRARQWWEGNVTAIRADEFVAVIKDRTNPSNPDEEVVVDVSEVSPVDKPLLQEGASFYWFIGSEITPAGQLKNISQFQFRRLPPWSASALKRGAQRAKSFRQLLSEPVEE